MFEITADDIALLSDEDLRALVGRLCESEMRRRGISASCVTWGGDQNAEDGGLDVRVALPPHVAADGFIPRRDTGLQVKAEDTPPSRIFSEMRPGGTLRPAIRRLADQSGAYIMVSSKGSTADFALQNRRDKMREAIDDLPNANALHLDFYDRKRIETWLRDHTGTALWVREKIGKPLHGWSGYGAWSRDPGSLGTEYLLDGELRIKASTQGTKPGLSAMEGIRHMRNILRNPKGVVRLVGLSGFGKTRLAQALFEEKADEPSLDRDLAIYTDFADSPNPQPIALVEELLTTRKRAILVVDNCGSDLHRRLTEVCRSDGSLLSLISIEFDIREDYPEETDVFVLEEASINLTESLVKRRFPTLSIVDARMIAEFSGGNARIAVALAGRLEKNESIAQLSSEELFRRLFQQRHGADEELFSAAQALSLVYSFKAESVTNDNGSELFLLGSLVGKNAQEMFRHSAELARRGLVQSRGAWRAVLPQAIANRLAMLALQNIPSGALDACFVRGGRQGLLKSFSRRLRYLHTSKEAQAIVSAWLGPGGPLENPLRFDELSDAIFNNVAPVAPDGALAVLERTPVEPKGVSSPRYLRLIRSLAYDAALFERCITLMLKILEKRNVDDDREEGRRIFVSLFPIYYSGTHATIEQRLSVIQSLAMSDSPKRRTLGIAGLTAALHTGFFVAGSEFEFGARSRDYGWWPQSMADFKGWFAKGLALAENLACSENLAAQKVRSTLAERFRGLWTEAGMYGDLERVCREIAKRGFWPEGWIAVRQTIHYDAGGMAPEISARLSSLEAVLRPKDLLERVRSVVLPEGLLLIGVDSTVDGSTDVETTVTQVRAVATELGKAVARDDRALVALLPELFASASEQVWAFGRGLAEAADDPNGIWNQLSGHLSVPSNSPRSLQVLHGFLSALDKRDSALANALLDNTVEDKVLGLWYPILQAAVSIDKNGVNRLIRSLEKDNAGIGTYRALVGGGVTHNIPGPDFNTLLMQIAEKPEGVDIAIELLLMRLSFAQGASSPSELVDIGCELLRRLRFGRGKIAEEYRFKVVARACLVGEKGAAATKEICRNLKDAVLKSETYAFYHAELLKILFSFQPVAALDGLCGGDSAELALGVSILNQTAYLGQNPFDVIPEAEVIAWCNQRPDIRYPVIAGGVTPQEAFNEAPNPRWSSVARKLLDGAPDKIAVLKEFTAKFIPTAWVGTRAAVIESNARLLDELAAYPDPLLTEFIAKEKVRLNEAIQAEKVARTSQRDLEPRALLEREGFDRSE